jgi:hypothetical protein
MAPDTGQLVAAILNSAWMVRHYERGGRSTILGRQRQRAIRTMGITVRDAFSHSEDFEPLLLAVLDGLAPKDEHPRF